jgi:hypothetical protein
LVESLGAILFQSPGKSAFSSVLIFIVSGIRASINHHIRWQPGAIGKDFQRSEGGCLAAVNHGRTFVVPASTVECGSLAIVFRVFGLADAVGCQLPDTVLHLAEDVLYCHAQFRLFRCWSNTSVAMSLVAAFFATAFHFLVSVSATFRITSVSKWITSFPRSISPDRVESTRRPRIFSIDFTIRLPGDGSAVPSLWNHSHLFLYIS